MDCLRDPVDPEAKGHVVKITYDVSQMADDFKPYSDFWMKWDVPGFDPTVWNTLSFWIRGDRAEGVATALKVELKVKEKLWAEKKIYYIHDIGEK